MPRDPVAPLQSWIGIPLEVEENPRPAFGTRHRQAGLVIAKRLRAAGVRALQSIHFSPGEMPGSIGLLQFLKAIFQRADAYPRVRIVGGQASIQPVGPE